ncbi:Erd1 [Schizosaccharomyces japonicus yFS275]|uniref:Erd1 n=1 Tax=Schizosaccharomyces japonicus (strain yFS275 / FY16936) TaxID=402676 RepID=B6K6K5_SCHJY|nr:Erd1 [Schizosaccharomyces japonicus yFS275]EEB09159.1 Erd1 [Schizosaccharomyces japonicus yFS275]
MDDLKHVQSAIESVPLLLRVAVLVVAGLYAYAFILHTLSRYHVDAYMVLRNQIGSVKSSVEGAPLMELTLFSAVLGTLAVMSSFMLDQAFKLDHITYIPLFMYGFLMFAPAHRFFYKQRRNFVTQCLRISTGNLSFETRFADVMFSDLLTSYSRVIADIWLAGAILIYEEPKHPRHDLRNKVMMALIAAYPYAIRFRQCLLEVKTWNLESDKFWSACNAVKYLTAFPSIFLGVPKSKRKSSLWFWWNTASAVNALYSFWWDVEKDWSLNLLTVPRSTSRPFGLSRRVFTRNTFLFAVVSDFVLRMAWVTRVLPPKYAAIFATDAGIFFMQCLEVFRRWQWVLFRIESEAAKTMSYTSLYDTDMENV